MNEVSLRLKARATATTAKSMEFDRLLECLDKLKSIYKLLNREKTKLKKENIDLSSSNK